MNINALSVFLERLDKVFGNLERERLEVRWRWLRKLPVPPTSGDRIRLVGADQGIWRGIANGYVASAGIPELHHRYRRYYHLLASGHIENDLELRELKQETSRRFESFTLMLDGKPARVPDLLRAVMVEADSMRRERAYAALSRLNRDLVPLVVQAAGLRNRLAQKYGYRDYGSFLFGSQDLTAALWHDLHNDLLRITASRQETVLEEVKAYLSKQDLRAGDLAYAVFYRNESVNHVFLWEILPAVLKRTLELLGIEDPIETVHFEDEYDSERPRFEFVQTASGQVSMYAQETRGMRFYRACFQAFGEAVSVVLAHESGPVMAELECACFRKAFGMFFSGLLGNPEWLHRVYEARPDIARHVASADGMRLLQTRLLGAAAAMELLLYQAPDEWPGQYGEVYQEHVLLNPGEDHFVLPLQQYMLEPGRTMFDHAARMLAAVLTAGLKQHCGGILESRAGTLIVNGLCNGMRRASWRARFESTFGKLDMTGAEGEFTNV
ncbi:hypothetical protein JW905_00170 [bacterium]|nr:hypothetical protein [candidate division CSSED10-310 bacterium]